MLGNVLYSAIAFVVVLGLLITVHEFGHYWVARKAGVKVLRFSIGFGKPLWTRVAGADRTEYVVAAIPLGGYVKMLDEREGAVDAHELHRAFNRQPVLKRIAIVAAGPFFNFFFAIAAYWLMFVIGVPGIKSIVEDVLPDTPAAIADVRAGDEIISVAGRSTPTWNAARQELLTRILDGGGADLEVRGKDGAVRHVRLNVQASATDLQDAKMFDRLGMRPVQIRIPPVLGDILRGEAAEKAGLREGDKILSANGVAVQDWVAWVELVRAHPDQDIALELERQGVTVRVTLHPTAMLDDGKTIGRIGAAPAPVEDAIPEAWRATVRYGVFSALVESTSRAWEMSVLTLRMMGKMLVGQMSVENLSGPITIAKYAGYTANVGLTAFLSFLAIVSVSLFVLNLLPIPVLDGGHLLYYVVEIILRRPLSDALQMKLQRVGLAILLVLMSIALYNDVARLLR